MLYFYLMQSKEKLNKYGIVNNVKTKKELVKTNC